mgnify:CR=1 FL=1
MLKDNLKNVEERVQEACDRAGRKREEVTLIAVSKTKPIEMLQEIYDENIRDFGENKVQELCDKIEKMPKDIKWHMIGHLQRNKVKYIVGQVALIHSVDSYRLAEEINIQAKKNSVVDNVLGTYAGGDCVTGPSTVINAVAAGKVAAANIDAYLGFNHEITVDVDIPTPIPNDHLPCGRVELKERFAKQRGNDFDEVEQGMSLEEAMQEASRCLRCDYHGFGSFRGGRDTKW